MRAAKFREFVHLLPNGFSYPTTATITSVTSGGGQYCVSVDNEEACARLTTGTVAVPSGREFYFAEGTTLAGFREFLLMANAGTATVEADVTYFFDDGSAPLATVVPIAASGRTTIDVALVVGSGRTGVSMRVLSPAPIVAERSVFFNRDFTVGPVSGQHVVLGAAAPRTHWAFAEGSTLDGFAEYLTIQNPTTETATVAISYGLEGGGADTSQVSVGPGQRHTIDVKADIGPGVVGHSTVVSSPVRG